MTPIADMVERMLADGVAHDVIVLAIRTAEHGVTTVTTRHDAVVTASRSKEAARAARYRENIKNRNALAKANDVANSRDDERDASRRAEKAPLLSIHKEGSFNEGLKEEKKQGIKRTEIARARGQRMVSGAILTDDFRAAAIDLGADPAHVPDMWVEFVDYWVAIPGIRGLKTDWPATWRNRVRTVLKRGKSNGRQQQSLGDVARDLAAKARDLEREAGLFGPDEPVRGH